MRDSDEDAVGLFASRSVAVRGPPITIGGRFASLAESVDDQLDLAIADDPESLVEVRATDTDLDGTCCTGQSQFSV